MVSGGARTWTPWVCHQRPCSLSPQYAYPAVYTMPILRRVSHWSVKPNHLTWVSGLYIQVLNMYCFRLIVQQILQILITQTELMSSFPLSPTHEHPVENGITIQPVKESQFWEFSLVLPFPPQLLHTSVLHILSITLPEDTLNLTFSLCPLSCTLIISCLNYRVSVCA